MTEIAADPDAALMEGNRYGKDRVHVSPQVRWQGQPGSSL